MSSPLNNITLHITIFLGQGRNIQPLPCQDNKGSRGVCMFAWNCAEAGGTHLGTCVDRFYFGSCCKLPVVIKPEDLDQMNSETDIQTDPSESIAAPVSKPKPSSTSELTLWKGCVILANEGHLQY